MSNKIRVVKVSFYIPEEEFESFKKCAYDKGMTATEALRRAVDAQKLIWKTQEEGGKILIDKGGNIITEIIFSK